MGWRADCTPAFIPTPIRRASATQGVAVLGGKRLQGDLLEQVQPVGEHLGFHVWPFKMDPLWIAVIAALEQNGIAPEGGDLVLMRGPVGDVFVENGSQHRVIAYAGIEGADLRVDLVGCRRKARRQGGSGHEGTEFDSVPCQYPVQLSGDRRGFVARFRRQDMAQQGHRMRPQAEAGGDVILDHLFAQCHLRQVGLRFIQRLALQIL